MLPDTAPTTPVETTTPPPPKTKTLLTDQLEGSSRLDYIGSGMGSSLYRRSIRFFIVNIRYHFVRPLNLGNHTRFRDPNTTKRMTIVVTFPRPRPTTNNIGDHTKSRRRIRLIQPWGLQPTRGKNTSTMNARFPTIQPQRNNYRQGTLTASKMNQHFTLPNHFRDRHQRINLTTRNHMRRSIFYLFRTIRDRSTNTRDNIKANTLNIQRHPTNHGTHFTLYNFLLHSNRNGTLLSTTNKRVYAGAKASFYCGGGH